MLLEVLETLQGLGDCGNVSGRDPPQDEDAHDDKTYLPSLGIARCLRQWSPGAFK